MLTPYCPAPAAPAPALRWRWAKPARPEAAGKHAERRRRSADRRVAQHRARTHSRLHVFDLRVLRDEQAADEPLRHLGAHRRDEPRHSGRRAAPPPRSHAPDIARRDSRRASSHKAKCDARSSRDTSFPNFSYACNCASLSQASQANKTTKTGCSRPTPRTPRPSSPSPITRVFTVSMYSHLQHSHTLLGSATAFTDPTRGTDGQATLGCCTLSLRTHHRHRLSCIHATSHIHTS